MASTTIPNQQQLKLQTYIELADYLHDLFEYTTEIQESPELRTKYTLTCLDAEHGTGDIALNNSSHEREWYREERDWEGGVIDWAVADANMRGGNPLHESARDIYIVVKMMVEELVGSMSEILMKEDGNEEMKHRLYDRLSKLAARADARENWCALKLVELRRRG